MERSKSAPIQKLASRPLSSRSGFSLSVGRCGSDFEPPAPWGQMEVPLPLTPKTCDLPPAPVLLLRTAAYLVIAVHHQWLAMTVEH